MQNTLRSFTVDKPPAIVRSRQILVVVLLGLLVSTVGLLVGPVTAFAQTPIVFDFEGASSPPEVTEFTVDGLTMTIAATGGIGEAWVFDSSNPTGGDEDLGTPNSTCPGGGPGEIEINGVVVGLQNPPVGGQVGAPGENCVALGNVLVIQENNTTPDDNASGGTLTFTFSEAVIVNYFDLLDFEETTTPSITFYDGPDGTGNQLGTPISPTGLGDNSYERFDPEADAGVFVVVTSIVMDLPISGAVGAIEVVRASEVLNPGQIGDTITCVDDGSPLPGVTVTLTGLPGGPITEVTDDAGMYLFDLLPLGDYTVAVDPSTITGACTEPAVDPDGVLDNTSDVTLTDAAPVDLDQDFAYSTPPVLGSIGDTIWCDDGDGVFQPGEGLAGIGVTLSNAGGLVDTTTTTGDGAYLFDELPLGPYTVTVDPTTLPATCNDPSVDPDPAAGTPNSSEVTLTDAVPDNPDQDFAYIAPPAPLGSIGDTIFCDDNGNGVPNAGEGIEGVTVSLTGPDGPAGTATTDVDGFYTFPGLPFGEYTVTVGAIPGTCTEASVDPDGVDTPNSSVVTINAANPDDEGQDFGYVEPPTPLGSIGDTIFCDADENGAFNAGEGIEGVTVSLTGPDGPAGTATTDADGFYTFPDLPFGEYTVTVGAIPGTCTDPSIDPDGVDTPNSSVVTIDAANPDDEGQDFGYVEPPAPLGSIGDTIFCDANENGAFEAGEGITGVMVTLTPPTGPAQTAETGADGFYLFEDLPEGNYTVTVNVGDLGSCNVPAVDPDPTLDSSSTVALGPGEDNVAQDFGYTEPAPQLGSIGDTIFCDANGNNNFDTGEGIENVTVTLTPPTGPDQTAETNADGQYIFTALPAGDYTIVVDTADLASCNVPTVDPDDTLDSSSTVALAEGEDNVLQDFGYVEPAAPLGSIGDTIFCDANGNGTADAGEGIANVTVTLSGDSTAVDTTDENGMYLFPDLAAGDYTVAVNVDNIPASCNIPSADPDGGNDNTADVTLTAGENNDTQDFGYTPLVDLALDKTLSEIGENQQYTFVVTVINEGENPATGVEVTDRLPAGLTLVSAETSEGAYVANTGLWTIGDMAVGQSETLTMVVTSDGAATYTNVAQISATDQPDVDSTPGNDDPTEDDQGQDTVGPDTAPVSIGDFVWIDANSNGLQDAGEVGLEGVTVTLYNGANAVVGSPATTDANGAYLFSDLVPGTYSVEFQLPAGYGLTTQNAGDDTLDSDPNPTTNRTDAVEVPEGENLTLDAGVIQLQPQMTVSKSAATATLIRGETIVYTINYANIGNGIAEDVQINEGIPAGTTFNAALSSTGWTCTPEGSCVYEAGDLAAGATGTPVQFAVTIDEDLPADVTRIDCAVTVSTTSSTDPGGRATTSTGITVVVPLDIEEGEEPGRSFFYYLPLLR